MSDGDFELRIFAYEEIRKYQRTAIFLTRPIPIPSGRLYMYNLICCQDAMMP